MARDNFPRAVIDQLARRVGYRCSNPDCRLPSAGPSASRSATNTGVAAHITAASPGGPRYDAALTPQERASSDNGIWLCQTHAKLIDDDEISYDADTLRDWKEQAERIAAVEAMGFTVNRRADFSKLGRLAPKLLEEMRADWKKSPTARHFFIVPSPRVIINGPGIWYDRETHPDLDNLAVMLENLGAVIEDTTGNTPRYRVMEEFADFLTNEVV